MMRRLFDCFWVFFPLRPQPVKPECPKGLLLPVHNPSRLILRATLSAEVVGTRHPPQILNFWGGERIQARAISRWLHYSSGCATISCRNGMRGGTIPDAEVVRLQDCSARRHH